MASSGSAMSTSPVRMSEPGIPENSAVASSCAITMPPADLMACTRAAPFTRAGENHGDGSLAEPLCRRAEQRIGRRPHEVLLARGSKHQAVSPANQQMLVRRRHVHPACKRPLTGARLYHHEGGAARENLRQVVFAGGREVPDHRNRQRKTGGPATGTIDSACSLPEEVASTTILYATGP